MADKGFKEDDIELGLLAEVPLSFAKGNRVLPIKKEDGALVAAVSGESGMLALRDLASHMGLKPRAVDMDEDELVELINRSYGRVGSAEEVMDNIASEDFSSVATEFEKPRDILELTEEAPIIRL
ncbi:hypothetical protein LCGC14_2521110, partial [marine sediment metagenome]